MKRTVISLLAIAVVVLLQTQMASAAMYHLDLDLASFGISAPDVELEIQLYDNDWVLGNSWARIDNVVLGSEILDFEAPSLDGFVEVYNPGDPDYAPSTVGNEDVGGNWVLRIDESPVYGSVIVYRDFIGRSGDVLSIDVEANLSDWDELVFSLLDPVSLLPLTGGFYGLGDVALVDSAGVHFVPVPGAVLLGVLGFGSAGLGLRRRLARS